MLWLALIVIGGFAVYVMRPDERTRLVDTADRMLVVAWEAFRRRRGKHDSFRDALDARTRAPFLTAAVVLLNLAIFGLMLAAPGRISDPDTLVRWGGSVGPVTTNGEWWRLLT